MRVQYERQPADGHLATADGDEVERLVEVGLSSIAKREVRCGDRRRESVVERLRDSQALVDAIPAQIERDLMDPQLPRVEEAQDLDAGEVRL